MVFIDFRAAGGGQISDKYQYYGLDYSPDGAAPSQSRLEVHQDLAQENRLLA